MKKTIKILAAEMEKLQEKNDGTLQGGFASIRGGFSFSDSTNQSCSNTKDCTKSTNTGTPTCTNYNTCLM
ncbi:hypothetical protein [Longitalea arenae]|uniref:hypothetical protein n=1 Tax=Longitalea arenae TaxID=2812558 RepID=UPI00196766D5|nr:hypothetical protein [Longitalea arenae]